MTRTHLKNTSARDMSQFPQDQGATTKVHSCSTPRRSDAGIAEIGHIPKGVAAVLPPRCVARRSRSTKTTVSSSRLARSAKLLATRTGGIFKMGSNNKCEICAFRNPKPTVTGIILKDKKLLLSKRSIEPFKGWWDLIGGYMIEKEVPEEALRREIKEELGVGCKSLKLIDFFPGTATYRQYEYPVVSIAYLVELDSQKFVIDKSELEELKWFSISELPPIAFDSNKKIVDYVKTRRII